MEDIHLTDKKITKSTNQPTKKQEITANTKYTQVCFIPKWVPINVHAHQCLSVLITQQVIPGRLPYDSDSFLLVLGASAQAETNPSLVWKEGVVSPG